MTKSELIKCLQAIEHIDPEYELSLEDDWLLFVCSHEFAHKVPSPGEGGIAEGAGLNESVAIDMSIPAGMVK